MDLKNQIQDRTVLVIDDDIELRDFTGLVLSEYCSLRYADNGEDGLRIARKILPCIIVLDVMMPGGMDGFSVFCELCKSEETMNIPVIMLTGVNEATNSCFNEDILGEYLGSAPSAFLEKPVNSGLLQQTVLRVLGDSQERLKGVDRM